MKNYYYVVAFGTDGKLYTYSCGNDFKNATDLFYNLSKEQQIGKVYIQQNGKILFESF